MPDVERRVVEQLGRNGALGPVGFLPGFVDRDPEVFLEQSGQANALATEQLSGEHRVENAFRAKLAEVVQ